MKKKECEQLGKKLQIELPGFTVRGWMMFMEPIGHILRAIVFDTSQWTADQFYVHVIAQPLFVPTENLVLSLGWRLGGGCHSWDRRSPNLLKDLANALQREAMPFLTRIKSPVDIAQTARIIGVKSPGEGGPYIQEAIAYGFAYEGDTAQAIRWLDAMEPSLDVHVGWQRETARRTQLLKHKLLADPLDARQQLETWENETVKHLGLEQFR